jgi:hypothetical protein
MDEANMDQLGVSHAEKLSKKYLTELQKSFEARRGEDDDDETMVPASSTTGMNLKDFKEVFNQLDSSINVTEGKNTNNDRSFLSQKNFRDSHIQLHRPL